MAWIRLALRRLADDRLPTIGFALLVAVTAFVAAVTPRVITSLSNGAVRAVVGESRAADRGLQFIAQDPLRPGPSDDPLAGVRATGTAIEGIAAESIEALVIDRAIVIESGRYRVLQPTTDPSFVRLRIEDRIAEHIRYIEGRAPTGRVTVIPYALRRPGDAGVAVYEASVSVATAEAFGLSMGARVPLEGDDSDPLIGPGPFDALAFLDIVGIYEVPDPAAEYWMEDPLPIRPVVRSLGGDSRLLDAAALLDPAAYPGLVAHQPAGFRLPHSGPLRYTWRSYVDADRIDSDAVAGLVLDLRRLVSSYRSTSVTSGSPTALRTGLPALLEGYVADRTAAESLLAVIAVGPVLVAGSTLALVAVLAARRRRSSLALARSRGASGGQVIVPVIAEGLLLAIPAAGLALLAALVAVPEPRGDAAPLVAFAVAVLAVVALVTTVASVAQGRGASARPGARVRSRPGARRLVLDLTVIGLAAAGVALLRGRGIRPTTSQGAVPGVDPFLAVVPALVGLAAGLVVIRAFPLVLRLVAAVAGRARGIVLLLAVRRASEPGPTTTILLVLLATTTVGSFAAVSLEHLDRGAEIAAWQEVGGELSVRATAGSLPATVDAGTLPGVQESAMTFEGSAPLGLGGIRVTFVAVEAARLASVLAGTPADPRLPPGFSTPGDGPIPVIVGTTVAGSPRGVALGESFRMVVEGYDLEYRVSEVRRSFPGIPFDEPFIVAPREWFMAKAPPARILPTVAVLRAAPSSAGAIRAALTERAPATRLESRAELAAGLRAAPITAAVRGLILAAALVTAAYAALGVAAALALSALARAEEVAHLRTLGLTPRQAAGLLLAEHGPPTLGALAGGLGLGAVLFLVLLPALGLGALVGSPVDVPLGLDVSGVLLILAAVLAVIALGLAIGAFLQRRLAPATALRGRYE